MERIFVVLGAGASRACASWGGDGSLIPPLAATLFDPIYMPILQNYPAALEAGDEIRAHASGAPGLEDFIRETYRDSPHQRDQRKFLSLPCYLQHLLYEVSLRYTRDPDNYGVLVATLLRRVEDVVFITLNYDTLLDQQLTAVDDPLDSLPAYVYLNRQWSLIKLHGSVDWGYPVDGPVNFGNPDPPLERRGGVALRKGELSEIRASIDAGEWFYPAVAVPMGPDDQLVCPPFHLEFLRTKLDSADPLHVLIIGYSAYDQRFLDLVKESGRQVTSVQVVNQDLATAQQVASRFRDGVGQAPREVMTYNQDFNNFIRSGALLSYLEKLGGA